MQTFYFLQGYKTHHKQEQRIAVKLDNTKLSRKAIPSSFHEKSLT